MTRTVPHTLTRVGAGAPALAGRRRRPSRPQKCSILTRAGEQRRRSQSMKSYPSSELRNVCDEHVTSEDPGEKEDLLQQMLERR